MYTGPKCYCKSNGQQTHTCPRFRGKPVKYEQPAREREERDDAAEKMERRYDDAVYDNCDR